MTLLISIRIEFYNGVVRAVSLPQHGFVVGLCLQIAVNHQFITCQKVSTVLEITSQ